MPDFVEQLAMHLQAWQLAGVQFIPKAGPMPEGYFVQAAEVEAAEAVDPLAARRQALQVLAKAVSTCETCRGLFSTRTQPVFGIGPVGAELCILGIAPSVADDAVALPFQGEPGTTLDKMLAWMGMAREEVYLSSVVKCLPPGRVPNDTEMKNCQGHLQAQLQQVLPKFILCMGELAAQSVLNLSGNLESLRGKVHHAGEMPVVCTYHPADMIRQPKLKPGCLEDLKMLLQAMGRKLPDR